MNCVLFRFSFIYLLFLITNDAILCENILIPFADQAYACLVKN